MMVCRVCRSPLRAQIDRALVAGALSLRDLAEQYGVSSSALHRHQRTCLPDELVQAVIAVQALDAEGCLVEADRLRRRAEQLLEDALERGDYRTALAAMAQCRGSLDLLLRVRLAEAAIHRKGPGPYECCVAYAHEYVSDILKRTLLGEAAEPPAVDELSDDEIDALTPTRRAAPRA